MQLPKLLFHPHVTLAATITAVSATALACTSLIGALEPVRQLPAFAQHVTSIDADLLTAGKLFGAAAAVLTVIAGLGRSWAPLIDNNGVTK